MLIRKNIKIHGHRTSTKLEKEMWEALTQISTETGESVDDICTHVRAEYGAGNFTSHLRVYILNYFRKSQRGTTTGQMPGISMPAR